MNNYTIAEHAASHPTHFQPPSFWSSTKVELPQHIFSFCISCIKDPITNHFLTECLKLLLKLFLKISFECKIKLITCTLLLKGTNTYTVVFRHRLPLMLHTVISVYRWIKTAQHKGYGANYVSSYLLGIARIKYC